METLTTAMTVLGILGSFLLGLIALAAILSPGSDD